MCISRRQRKQGDDKWFCSCWLSRTKEGECLREGETERERDQLWSPLRAEWEQFRSYLVSFVDVQRHVIKAQLLRPSCETFISSRGVSTSPYATCFITDEDTALHGLFNIELQNMQATSRHWSNTHKLISLIKFYHFIKWLRCDSTLLPHLDFNLAQTPLTALLLICNWSELELTYFVIFWLSN